MERADIRSKEDVIKYLSEKTEFEKSVLVATFEIPEGKVSTYKRIAEKVGRPHAYRAVGNALHKNPLAPIVPCHRVVRSDGNLAGQKEEVRVRRRRLEEEGISLEGNRVKMASEILF